MSSRYQKHRLMALFCAFGFTICLWLGQLSSTNLQVQLGEVATAQNSNPSQLVQKGIDSYRLGNFQQAINSWNEALKSYENNQNPSSEVIVRENLARAYPQIGQTEAAIKNWEQVISFYQKLQSTQQKEEKIKTEQKIARAKTELAQVYSSIGQPKKAIALLCNPKENDNNEDNKKENDNNKDSNENCTKNSVLQFARDIKDTNLEVAILGTLGDAYRLTGTDDYKKAIYYLESGLEKAKNNHVYLTSLNNSLGNTYLQEALLNYRRALSPVGSYDDTSKFKIYANKEIKKAQIHLQESLTSAQRQSDKNSEIKAIESLGRLYKSLEEFKIILDTNNPPNKIIPDQEVTKLLSQLPRNRERVYTTINLINLRKSTARKCIGADFDKQAEELLDDAINIAQTLKDSRAESFALGEKGHIYECRQEYGSAIAFTEKARVAAETGKSPDSLYLWEWQTGRILKTQNQTEEAIKAYERAINTLEGSTRADILTANRDIQFDFRDSIEPIYRDLVAMKLSLETSVEASGKSIDAKNSKINFSSILKTIDSLKLAELQNYFGDDCNFPAFVQSRDNLRNVRADNFLNELFQPQDYLKNTAFISTFILEDKTAIILTLPNGKNELRWYFKKRDKVENEIDQFRIDTQTLTGRRDYYLKSGKNVYDWMIGKFEILQQKEDKNYIDTLVFIQDGIFRNVPMAALYDDKNDKFLIQRYAIATVPSLTLTKPEPMNRQNLRVLALGLSKETKIDGKPFKALFNVVEEVEQVRKKISGKQLLDPQFTYENIKKELKKDSYPIIHIATHGQFGIRPEDTFIVTGDRKKITFNELDKIIRRFARNTEPLELLALTACETGTGDNRSALGLGGVAVQAGAKSALASLWVIDDGIAAQLAVGFYDELLRNSKITKAKALQTVLRKFIENEKLDDNGKTFYHPRYWSPFVIIGNWL